jgi:peptidoglycan/xylan/chitin deacetylase (PgdA/CDA1 family)
MRLLTATLRTAGVLLYWLGLHRVIIWLNRRQVRVLLYHACEETESDFIRGLQSNTPPDVLARHLDFLRRYYNVVPATALPDGNLPDRAAVITFDDGYDSVRTSAFPLLRARGLPATIYLVSGVIGNRALVWVNALNWLLRRHPATTRPLVSETHPDTTGRPVEAVLNIIRDNYDPELVSALIERSFRAAGADPASVSRDAGLYLTEDGIVELAANGITFGNHTRSHPNLARLSLAQQRAEMLEAEEALAGHPGWVKSLAYPFGDHTTDTRQLALSLGYESVMLVGGVRAPLDRSRVSRVPVSPSGTATFFAEVEVVAPMKGLLRKLIRRAA